VPTTSIFDTAKSGENTVTITKTTRATKAAETAKNTFLPNEVLGLNLATEVFSLLTAGFRDLATDACCGLTLFGFGFRSKS
jgi:hypothetical protein